jgi:Clr5 domain
MSETLSRIVEAAFNAPQISDWERHRDLIMKLYLEEGKTLMEVKSILQKQHGFEAT